MINVMIEATWHCVCTYFENYMIFEVDRWCEKDERRYFEHAPASGSARSTSHIAGLVSPRPAINTHLCTHIVLYSSCGGNEDVKMDEWSHQDGQN